MHLSREWTILLDQAEFLNEYGQPYARLLRRPGMQETFDATFAELHALVAPAAVWEYFSVEEVRHEKLVLADDGGRRAQIGNGPVTTVMGGAEQVVIGVCTVGQAVVDRIHEHRDVGAAVASLLLDHLATLAVAQLSQLLYRRLEMDAALDGCSPRHISTYLSPGESEWSIKDQAVIFRLVDAGQIGVSLTESLLMTPVKSLSLMAGIGPVAMRVPGATHCDYCTMQERCPFHGKHGVVG